MGLDRVVALESSELCHFIPDNNVTQETSEKINKIVRNDVLS